MPSNAGARVDISLLIDKEEVEAELQRHLKAKDEVIRKLFQEAGQLYKTALAQRIPTLGLGELNRSFKYKTTPASSRYGITLTAGILKTVQFDKVHDFLRFWLYGTEDHWVSLQAHPELAQWALQHGVIIDGGGYYYQTGNRITKFGRPYKTRALKVGMRGHLHDVSRIRQEVIRQLIQKLNAL